MEPIKVQMPDIPLHNCGNCGHIWSPDGKQFFCRRNPPYIYPVEMKGQVIPRSCFPPVLPIWTCGEWKTKIMMAN